MAGFELWRQANKFKHKKLTFKKLPTKLLVFLFVTWYFVDAIQAKIN